jgi:hypothetical protein
MRHSVFEGKEVLFVFQIISLRLQPRMKLQNRTISARVKGLASHRELGAKVVSYNFYCQPK